MLHFYLEQKTYFAFSTLIVFCMNGNKKFNRVHFLDCFISTSIQNKFGMKLELN